MVLTTIVSVIESAGKLIVPEAVKFPSVVAPVTPKVPVMVVLGVIFTALALVAPIAKAVAVERSTPPLAYKTPVSVEIPVTPRVEDKVVAPVTPKVPPTVSLLVTATVPLPSILNIKVPLPGAPW